MGVEHHSYFKDEEKSTLYEHKEESTAKTTQILNNTRSKTHTQTDSIKQYTQHEKREKKNNTENGLSNGEKKKGSDTSTNKNKFK